MTERGKEMQDRALPERLAPLPVKGLSREEFYRRFPADAFMDRAMERRGRERSSGWLAMTLGGAGAAALAVLVFVVVGPFATAPSPDAVREQVRMPFGFGGAVLDKGTIGAVQAPDAGQQAPLLSVLLWQDGDSTRLTEGQVLRAGDIVRFRYDSTVYEFLYLFSVDDSGRISPYYPYGPAWSIPIVRGRDVPLPDGVQLDRYVGHERIFALFSDKPVSYVHVGNAVSSAWMQARARNQGIEAVIQLPIPCAQASFLIEKR